MLWCHFSLLVFPAHLWNTPIKTFYITNRPPPPKKKTFPYIITFGDCRMGARQGETRTFLQIDLRSLQPFQPWSGFVLVAPDHLRANPLTTPSNTPISLIINEKYILYDIQPFYKRFVLTLGFFTFWMVFAGKYVDLPWQCLLHGSVIILYQALWHVSIGYSYNL